MNELPSDKALKDRIYSIQIDGYDVKDKVEIICNYIVPSILKEINIELTDIVISKDMAKYIIYETKNESIPGIRVIERKMHDIITKIDFYCRHPKIVHNEILSKLKLPVTLNKKIIDEILNS